MHSALHAAESQYTLWRHTSLSWPGAPSEMQVVAECEGIVQGQLVTSSGGMKAAQATPAPQQNTVKYWLMTFLACIQVRYDAKSACTPSRFKQTFNTFDMSKPSRCSLHRSGGQIPLIVQAVMGKGTS